MYHRWKKTAPKKPGVYHFRCMETDQKPETREVREGQFVRGYGRLWVECPDTGKHPVESYHWNLCDPSWKFVSELPNT